MSHSSVVRVVLSLLAIGVCLLLMQSAARIGYSRLLSRYAISANSLPAADQAIQISPADPDAHRARAIVLTGAHNYADAEASLETAATLRPAHANLWLALGNTREELGDRAGALNAFNEAVRAAPYYGQPHWQRGNFLLRLGRYDEAIADLRSAAGSDRRLLPNFIDLAWGLSGSDVKHMEELIALGTGRDRLEFVYFLARKGKGSEVLAQVGLLNDPLSLQNKEELERLLVAAKQFRDAFRLWKDSGISEGFVNGGFNDPFRFDGWSFRWMISQSQANVKFAQDVSEKFGGEKSLQISFNGESNPGESLMSQIIVLGPGRYRINFSVKTKDLVTGGPPRIVVTNATSNETLAKSEPFARATSSWSSLGVEFEMAATDALDVRLVRDNCSSSPCPIFGVLWLDEFYITNIEKR